MGRRAPVHRLPTWTRASLQQGRPGLFDILLTIRIKTPMLSVIGVRCPACPWLRPPFGSPGWPSLKVAPGFWTLLLRTIPSKISLRLAPLWPCFRPFPAMFRACWWVFDLSNRSCYKVNHRGLNATQAPVVVSIEYPSGPSARSLVVFCISGIARYLTALNFYDLI